jgi:hypothetical protein
MDTPPHGLLITQVNGYPDGLLAIPDKNGSPRIIVPKSQVEGLVLQCHEDIHHQRHVKVLHILKSLFYWPGMSAEVERICTACQTCMTASVRRKHLKTKFDLHARTTINGNAKARLRDRLLWSVQGGNHGHRGSIHEGSHSDPPQQQNARRYCLNNTQTCNFSTRRSTITQNGQRPRTIIPYGSSISHL